MYTQFSYIRHRSTMFFNEYKSGEAIVKKLFGKARGQNEDTTNHYATLIASDNYKKNNKTRKLKTK